MIKAIIFDFFGVLEKGEQANATLLAYIKKELRPDYKLGIISNSTGSWMGEMLAEDQVKLFDDIVLSHKVGVAKPEPAIYELSLSNLGVKAREAVFIDDTEEYCLAAQSVGIQAVWYQNFEKFKADLEERLTTVSDN